MKTPKEFDYDLWKTEDGKYMVRVKRTGEECEVDQDTMRLLRAEEKALRRSFQGPEDTSDSEKGKERITILSLDYFASLPSKETTPAWLEDSTSMEEDTAVRLLTDEFLKLLTPRQLDVFKKCMQEGLSLREYSRQNGLTVNAVYEAQTFIRKKFKKYFF